MAARDDIIELRAINPDGDLACDITVATEGARSGLHEDLARDLVPPVRRLDDGVEVTFRLSAWNAVRRYIELESQCCSFLTLAARRTQDAVILSVTGRPEAQAWIDQIFSTQTH